MKQKEHGIEKPDEKVYNYIQWVDSDTVVVFAAFNGEFQTGLQLTHAVLLLEKGHNPLPECMALGSRVWAGFQPLKPLSPYAIVQDTPTHTCGSPDIKATALAPPL